MRYLLLRQATNRGLSGCLLTRPLGLRAFHDTGYAYRQSIERGRSRYRTRNLLTAASLGLGVIGIYYYVIWSVEQEDYSDIPMPPELTEEEKRAREQATASKDD
ncbi:hypothetical protein EV182_001634 [Spiromyces aspiralis]|uniref:Uncharacterized protein n=1 Tax=Spiromyces aspiralis TaxID=68401 RepID=A0ACC1HIQ5_9FUNG|nr:hypothetical protein EV182_001634 [Spiromyces aspiralis]